jgi:hypothetical protein
MYAEYSPLYMVKTVFVGGHEKSSPPCFKIFVEFSVCYRRVGTLASTAQD